MKTPKTYRPRRSVPFNTGTRVIWSRKDKANRRAVLNRETRRMMEEC